MRDSCSVSALVDASDYFRAVKAAIELAANEIFISGWWVNAGLRLIRGESENASLGEVLEAAVARGVQVYVLLYKEQAIAMPNNSQYAEEELSSLGVHVMRHPHPLDFDATLWSHHEKIVVIDRRVAFIGGIDLAPGRYDTSDHICCCRSSSSSSASAAESSMKVLSRDDFFPGQDYWNARAGDFKPHLCGEKAWTSDPFDVEAFPRMGWHDAAVVVSGGEIVCDICRHFIYRWLHHRADAVKMNKSIPCILPSTTGIFHGGGGGNLTAEGIVKLSNVQFSNCSKAVVQVLRSSSSWSAGIKTERSIYNCLLRLIESSRSVIYIENQYFVVGFGEVAEDDEVDVEVDSDTADHSHRLVKNGIGKAIFNRISAAVEAAEKFMVVVVYPHLAWEHNPVQSTILHAQNEAIRALLQMLKEAHPEVADWGEYISLNNLRTWGEMEGGGGAKMEEIYLHDKLMIVDDRSVLIGSANINDRSLLGSRDSEIALLLHDADTKSGKIGGKSVNVGSFAHSLRVRLWMEHLGLSDPALVEDPLGEGADRWRCMARANRRIYESCFPSMHRNEYKKVKDVPGMSASKWISNPSCNSEDALGLQFIKGFVVEAAPYFLEDENLLPKVGTKAFLMPLSMFV